MPFAGRNYQLSFPAEQCKLRIIYKNFMQYKGISHIGLGVAALNIAKVLRAHGIDSDVWSLDNDQAVIQKIGQEMKAEKPPTHIVVSAPWLSTETLRGLCVTYPNLGLGVNCHSNVGFLQADANGVRLLREYMQLETACWNFRLSGNSLRLCEWVKDSYRANCAYLPNLYWMNGEMPRYNIWGGHGLIRIGAFGALRPLKNFMSAAAAALEIAAVSHADLEFWVNGGRMEGGGDTVYRAIVEMFRNVPFAQLKTVTWQPWPVFRDTVHHMNLLIQPSYSESFCMVVADGVAVGVPSVVSDAIEWAPNHWKADVDDVFSIARTGRNLLHDPHAVSDGWNALQENNHTGTRAWQSYLSGKRED